MASATTMPKVVTAKRLAAARAGLVETDGEPLETPWHRDEIGLLIDMLRWRWRDRTDFFAGGNMFIYYSLTRAGNRKYKGPDFFFVNHVDGKRERLYWWVYEENGRLPDVIVELNSRTTMKTDLTIKKELYEQRFKTPEYYCYDPRKRRLLGWRLRDDSYQPIEPNERGWLWCEQLQVWLGTWEGSYLQTQACWLRFYEKDGSFIPTNAEAVEAQAKLAAAHASALGVEVARLQAMLAAKQPGNGRSKGNGNGNGKSKGKINGKK